MSNILVLPGSRWQEALVRRSKNMGHNVYVVSPEAEPSCAQWADYFFRSDIFDLDKITKFCKEQKIEAVITDECDIAIPVVAELGARLGLHTINKRVARLYTDKFWMREFCKKQGLRFPEYKLCKREEDAVILLKELGRPIIIKPLDSNASHGVFIVRNEQDIYKHFKESLSYSKVEKAVLAERYIEGTEFTIDGIKTKQRHYTLAISEKKHFEHNKNIACQLFFTHKSECYDYDRIREINDAFVLNSGLEYGFTHAEYKYENGEYYLIEIGARGGGNEISSLITQYMSGYDTYKYLIDCSVGDFYEQDFSIKSKYQERAAVLYFLKTPHNGGIVKSIYGEDFLRNNPDILDYSLNFELGDKIENALNDSARVGFYIAGKEDKNALKSLIKEINYKFYIEVE